MTSTKTQAVPAIVHARVRADALERLKSLAARNERSVGAELRLALREHLDRAGDDAARTAPADT